MFVKHSDKKWLERINIRLAEIGGALTPTSADLLRAARAICEADRRTPRRSCRKTRDLWTREVELQLFVGNAGSWTRTEVFQQLRSVLSFLSGDTWEASLESSVQRQAVIQLSLLASEVKSGNELPIICLCSEGVDSIGGLVLRMLACPSREFVAVHVWSNSQRLHIFRECLRNLPADFRNRLRPIEIPMYASCEYQERKELSRRAMGFSFLAVGAAVAISLNASAVEMYENGIEAISLAFNDPAVPERASRMMHPITLYRMSRLVEALTGTEFSFQGPFILSTKQMLVSHALSSVPASVLAGTMSCERFRTRRGLRYHCGRCAGCLLRNAAFTACGISKSLPHFLRRRADINRIAFANASEEEMDNLDYCAEMIDEALCAEGTCAALLDLTSLCFEEREELLQALVVSTNSSCERVEEEFVALFRTHLSEWREFQLRIGSPQQIIQTQQGEAIGFHKKH
jgi:7-cyano-7-deazaguanine synthase in queuosine biosynthesis